MDSRSDETTNVDIYLRKFKRDKKYKEEIVKEIIAAICAMLNTDGGKVVIHFKNSVADSSQLNNSDILHDKDLIPQISGVTRILDQNMISIIGVEQTTSKINFKEDEKNIIVSVKRVESLVTTNYNLYSPSQTQVVKVSPLKPPKEIKEDVINRKSVVLEPVQLGTHCRKFSKNEQCGFNESTVCQWKHLKADPSKCTTLADRMIAKGNKFPCYVSAFGNHRGGHIYFGIRDDTKVVEGEKVPDDKSRNEIIKKVEKTINQMIWPEHIGQPKRGKQWEIFFEPIKDTNSNHIPSTFVIVIYIAPCLGGVFTEKPECYEMVEGEVKQMAFASWKKRISRPVWLQKLRKKKKIESEVITWSSDAVRKAFTTECDELSKIISSGTWENFEDESSSPQNESDLHETMKSLISYFKKITACNRKGSFEFAKEFLRKYQLLVPKVQDRKDRFIFEVLGLYLEAAQKRATGEFERLKDLLTEALSKAERIEPGMVTATVYIFAATVSDLKNLDCDLESPAVLTERALEHLECVPDSSGVLAAMIRRKANIILATFHLACNVSGKLSKDSIDIASLEKAMACIKAIYESAYEEHPLSVYYEIQLNLVLSIFKYRHSQLYPDQRIRNLRNACRYTKKAQSLAQKYNFTEMFKWSKNNEDFCTQELERAKIPVPNRVRHSDHARNDPRSEERRNQPERTDRGHCVGQRKGNDDRKSSKKPCNPRNPTEQVTRQDLKDHSTVPPQENDDGPGSTSCTRDVTQKAESQVVCSKSQKLDDPNVERNSQVETVNEEALSGAQIKPTLNNVKESKAQDSGDEQARPQSDGVTPSGREKQLNTPAGQSDLSKHVNAKPFIPQTTSPPSRVNHQISVNVSPAQTQPETSAQLMNNAGMPMHDGSVLKGTTSSGRHTGTSPIANQRFSDFGLSFVGPRLSQAQGPIHALPPSAPSYPAESTYGGQVPDYPPPTCVAHQPGVLVDHRVPMMMAPSMPGAGGYCARFPIQTLYQRFPGWQWAALQPQQQQAFGNHNVAYDGTRTKRDKDRGQHKHWRTK